MSNPICFEVRDGIGVIRVDNPPVNALSAGVPEGIASAVNAARSDPAVDALVIVGGGRTFVAGADIHEFVKAVSGESAMPVFHDAFNAVEASSKPVVMAIHGTALGGGLELAMAGHYRVATADAQLGQPEVKIGLIPGAGGTQRMPRLAGVRKAAEMCAFGEPISAGDALEAGIIDKIVEGDLLEGAIRFARQVAGPDSGNVPRRTCDLDVTPAAIDDIRERCRKTRRNQTAPLAALDAIEIAMRAPFEEGCDKELEIFKRCLFEGQAKALMHVFFAERTAWKVPDLPKDTPVSPIRNAAVIGAGTMGAGIAMALADAGIRVRMRDTTQAALDRAMAAIRANYSRSVSSGRISAQAMEERVARITVQLDATGFENADLMIEAVFESLELKQRVFQEMDKLAKPGCLLASNTSTLDIDTMAAATSRPEMVIGLHFFSPANIMRLLEIVRGKDTGIPAIATALVLAKTLKKVPVVVRNRFGFIGNRLFVPYINEAQFLVEEGATPEQVDRVLNEFGMAMGPFAVMDLSGLDVFQLIEQERLRCGVGSTRTPASLSKLVALGRHGQKTGAGWFRYGADRKPVADPEVVELARTGSRAIPDAEILDRCLRAVVVEGRRVVEEGIAQRASDIDVVFVNGFGFPGYRGGPMFYADHFLPP